MTHQERISYLTTLPRETLSPKELAAVIGGDPYSYNLQAKAGTLTLPHVWRGRNLRIFRAPVLKLLQGGLEP